MDTKRIQGLQDITLAGTNEPGATSQAARYAALGGAIAAVDQLLGHFG